MMKIIISLFKPTIMTFYLLDGVAAGFVYGVMIVFMGVTILLEAITMLLLKYNRFGKALIDSFIINLVSLAAGYWMLFFNSGSIRLTDSFLLNLFIMFIVTIFVEFGILYLLNRKIPARKTSIAALVINVVSYGLYFLVSILAVGL